jgi:hypothetical protein
MVSDILCTVAGKLASVLRPINTSVKSELTPQGPGFQLQSSIPAFMPPNPMPPRLPPNQFSSVAGMLSPDLPDSLPQRPLPSLPSDGTQLKQECSFGPLHPPGTICSILGTHQVNKLKLVCKETRTKSNTGTLISTTRYLPHKECDIAVVSIHAVIEIFLMPKTLQSLPVVLCVQFVAGFFSCPGGFA